MSSLLDTLYVKRARGFTLVELLVSIGVIAILMSFLLPALSGARESAKKLQSLNNLQQIGLSTQLYIDDSRGLYPFYTQETPHIIGPPHQPMGILFVHDDRWSMRYLWPTVMHRVAEWENHYSSWVGVGREYGELPWLSDSGAWIHPSYHMSNSFVASSATWSDSGTPRIEPTRQAQVKFTSAKVLFFDHVRPHIGSHNRAEQTRGVLFCDGSASDVNDDDATRPVMNRITELEPKLYHDTPDGINGRDF